MEHIIAKMFREFEHPIFVILRQNYKPSFVWLFSH
jgi:hypothetical protein